MENKTKSNNFKIILLTFLLTLVLIISFQNLNPVELDILVWKIETPLVLLLTINTICVAIITYIVAKWKR